jgi:phosphatidylserine/phosphatidylglycerophosphate/cardiolipin synthase-like enzyme
MKLMRLLLVLFPIVLAGCATQGKPVDWCPPNTQALPGCPPLDAVSDPELSEWYEYRGWRSEAVMSKDPVQRGIEAEIEVQDARLKLLGTSEKDALYSLAAKIYLIENADHSVDAAYYILKDDLAGRAFLGALCEAVQRGVDVRLMVDSVGTISIDREVLRALYHCQLDADFIRNPEGQVTTERARVQVVIFNAVSNLLTNPNRRSHDKLLVVDGFVPEKAFVMTGGRNISLSYYGINADGTPNPDTYLDAELLLRPGDPGIDGPTVSQISEIYFSLLYSFKDNKYLSAAPGDDGKTAYPDFEYSLKTALATLKALPRMASSLEAMPQYLETGYRHGQVRLAHEFGNLVNKRVITEAVANMANNPNSIMYILSQANSEREQHVRVVSPYLFAARYYGPDGEVLLDEAEEVKRWLAADPGRTYEIITNSVLTSDNFSAQAVVDMSMAPNVLLDPEEIEMWRSSADVERPTSELLQSEAWLAMLAHPQLKVYETGRIDDRAIGGDVDYGKLHAKYMITDLYGFLGTANFDYRSRLFNNEMGFFFKSDGLTDDLLQDFELLKSKSYQWGSPEWLEMRRKVIDYGGIKGRTTKNQRSIYRFLRGTGLKWYF